MSKWILGISAFYHDSAAVLLRNGEIICAVQEERFTRKKFDERFPVNSIKWCLSHAGINIGDLDIVVFYDKPFLKFERLLETYYAYAPKGIKSFRSAMPVWIKEKMFIKKIIREELAECDLIEQTKKKEYKYKLLFPEHHLSHASSAFFPSPYKDAAIVTLDGVGEWATTTIGYGEDNKITVLKEIDFPHSIGLIYSAFTYYCGFRVNSGEYKLMGLAPYGNPESDKVKKYIELIENNLIDIQEDGSIWLNMEYNDYATGLKMTNDKKWTELFGLPPRKPETQLTQDYCDLAYAIQAVTEKIIFKICKHARKITNKNNLVLAGGVALNCVANGKLLKSGIFDDIWIQPAAGDSGGALGAALAAWYIYCENERITDTKDKMKGSLLGPDFAEHDIKKVIMKYNAAKYKKYKDYDELNKKVAQLLDEGNVIGWFQGRMEYGPRALGNRSILGDPRNKEMQKKLNLKIKYRESFRPFAPSVLYENTEEFFKISTASPYMLLVTDVQENRCNKLPDNYHQLPLKEKLYYLRSDIPAITHLDFSARIQTVHKDINPKYWNMINAFKDLTGYGVIVNTSFNVRGEPIVMNPEHAYLCFMRTEMDYLVLHNYLFDKREQPQLVEKKDWREDLELD